MAVHHRNRDFNLKSREIIFEFSFFLRIGFFFELCASFVKTRMRFEIVIKVIIIASDSKFFILIVILYRSNWKFLFSDSR